MSLVPRPNIRPSRTRGVNKLAGAATTSVWPHSISTGPPPVPRSLPTTFGRPGSASESSTSSPAARAPRDQGRDGSLARAAGDETGIGRVAGHERPSSCSSERLTRAWPRSRARSARWQPHAPRASRRTVQPREHAPPGFAAELAGRLRDDGQGRIDQGRPLEVVEADERDVVRARAGRGVAAKRASCPTVMKLLEQKSAVGPRAEPQQAPAPRGSRRARLEPPTEMRSAETAMPGGRRAAAR